MKDLKRFDFYDDQEGHYGMREDPSGFYTEYYKALAIQEERDEWKEKAIKAEAEVEKWSARAVKHLIDLGEAVGEVYKLRTALQEMKEYADEYLQIQTEDCRRNPTNAWVEQIRTDIAKAKKLLEERK